MHDSEWSWLWGKWAGGRLKFWHKNDRNGGWQSATNGKSWCNYKQKTTSNQQNLVRTWDLGYEINVFSKYIVNDLQLFLKDQNKKICDYFVPVCVAYECVLTCLLTFYACWCYLIVIWVMWLCVLQHVLRFVLMCMLMSVPLFMFVSWCVWWMMTAKWCACVGMWWLVNDCIIVWVIVNSCVYWYVIIIDVCWCVTVCKVILTCDGLLINVCWCVINIPVTIIWVWWVS